LNRRGSSAPSRPACIKFRLKCMGLSAVSGPSPVALPQELGHTQPNCLHGQLHAPRRAPKGRFRPQNYDSADLRLLRPTLRSADDGGVRRSSQAQSDQRCRWRRSSRQLALAPERLRASTARQAPGLSKWRALSRLSGCYRVCAWLEFETFHARRSLHGDLHP
jgi:hypothetical protein